MVLRISHQASDPKIFYWLLVQNHLGPAIVSSCKTLCPYRLVLDGLRKQARRWIKLAMSFCHGQAYITWYKPKCVRLYHQKETKNWDLFPLLLFKCWVVSIYLFLFYFTHSLSQIQLLCFCLFVSCQLFSSYLWVLPRQLFGTAFLNITCFSCLKLIIRKMWARWETEIALIVVKIAAS